MKERYLWIIFIVAVATAAVYYRSISSNPQIGISVRFSNQNLSSSVYQYQQVSLPISVKNTGSAEISNFDIGLFVNGTLYKTYSISNLPPGRSADLFFNYTFQGYGSYSFSVIADPGHLYNIPNRTSTVAYENFSVSAPEQPNPASDLPSANRSFYSTYSYRTLGLILSIYLSKVYNQSAFSISGIQPFNNYIYPLLNTTSPYVANLDAAYAGYKNGSYIMSFWLDGYLSPSVFSIASQAKGLYNTNYTIDNSTVSFSRINATTTLCTRYSGGWIKGIVYVGGNCISELNYTNATQSLPVRTFPRLTYPANSDIESIYNFSNGTAFVLGINGSYLGYRIEKEMPSSANMTCFGIISISDNRSYCSTYLQPYGSKNYSYLQNLSMIETQAYLGNYSISIFSPVNKALILAQPSENINYINELGITGKSEAFSSGFANTCSFGNLFACTNASFSGNTLSVVLSSSQNYTIVSASCTLYGNSTVEKEDYHTLGKAPLNITCYNHSEPLQGIPLGLTLDLQLNYTKPNATKQYSASGNAYIV